MRLAVAAFALAALPAIATAGTLTFDDGTYSNVAVSSPHTHYATKYDTYTEDGYSFQTAADDWFFTGPGAKALGWCNDSLDYWYKQKISKKNYVTKWKEGNGHQVIVQTYAKGEFDLCQFDANGCDKLLLTGSNGKKFVADVSSSWKTFTLGTLFHDVTWVKWEIFGKCWDPCSGSTCIDNVVHCDPVPEPTTLALLGAGAAGMLALRRRRSA